LKTGKENQGNQQQALLTSPPTSSAGNWLKIKQKNKYIGIYLNFHAKNNKTHTQEKINVTFCVKIEIRNIILAIFSQCG